MVNAPLVLVTSRRLAAGRVKGWHGEGIGERVSYLERVQAAGGMPVVVGSTSCLDADVSALVARADGIVLTGGPDVEPARYRATPHATVYGTDAGVDDFEFAIVHAALATRTPLLAICRGIQVLNVALGGSLYQHVPELAGVLAHGRPGEKDGARLHTVALDGASMLAEVMRTDAPSCSCHHHQSIERLGDGLRVVGTAADGVVEAIECDDTEQFVLAVQWHPEDTAPHDPAQQHLFDALVERARP